MSLGWNYENSSYENGTSTCYHFVFVADSGNFPLLHHPIWLTRQNCALSVTEGYHHVSPLVRYGPGAPEIPTLNQNYSG